MINNKCRSGAPLSRTGRSVLCAEEMVKVRKTCYEIRNFYSSCHKIHLSWWADRWIFPALLNGEVSIIASTYAWQVLVFRQSDIKVDSEVLLASEY